MQLGVCMDTDIKLCAKMCTSGKSKEKPTTRFAPRGSWERGRVGRTKDTLNRVKRRPTEWEKVFPSHISDKGLVRRIHRQLLKLNDKKEQTIQLKMGKS